MGHKHLVDEMTNLAMVCGAGYDAFNAIFGYVRLIGDDYQGFVFHKRKGNPDFDAKYPAEILEMVRQLTERLPELTLQLGELAITDGSVIAIK